MRKIVGFKINLRSREVQRRAKKAKLDLEAAGLGEAELELLLDKTAKAVVPAVLFDTFPHSDPEQTQLSPLRGLAYSAVVATLGQAFEELARQSCASRPERGPVWPIVREIALEECVRFAASLIEDEAIKESCELSPISPVSEPAALETAVKKLEAGKIAVTFDGGRLSPEASAVVSLSWVAKAKAKGKK